MMWAHNCGVSGGVSEGWCAFGLAERPVGDNFRVLMQLVQGYAYQLGARPPLRLWRGLSKFLRSDYRGVMPPVFGPDASACVAPLSASTVSQDDAHWLQPPTEPPYDQIPPSHAYAPGPVHAGSNC